MESSLDLLAERSQSKGIELAGFIGGDNLAQDFGAFVSDDEAIDDDRFIERGVEGVARVVVIGGNGFSEAHEEIGTGLESDGVGLWRRCGGRRVVLRADGRLWSGLRDVFIDGANGGNC